MTKSDLIAQLALKMDIPTRQATSIVNTILETMVDTLAQGENVEIRDFGSFTVKDYGAYNGRNPKTEEIIKVAPKKLPCFRVGRKLHEEMNE